MSSYWENPPGDWAWPDLFDIDKMMELREVSRRGVEVGVVDERNRVGGPTEKEDPTVEEEEKEDPGGGPSPSFIPDPLSLIWEEHKDRDLGPAAYAVMDAEEKDRLLLLDKEREEMEEREKIRMEKFDEVKRVKLAEKAEREKRERKEEEERQERERKWEEERQEEERLKLEWLKEAKRKGWGPWKKKKVHIPLPDLPDWFNPENPEDISGWDPARLPQTLTRITPNMLVEEDGGGGIVRSLANLYPPRIYTFMI